MTALQMIALSRWRGRNCHLTISAKTGVLFARHSLQAVLRVAEAMRRFPSLHPPARGTDQQFDRRPSSPDRAPLDTYYSPREAMMPSMTKVIPLLLIGLQSAPMRAARPRRPRVNNRLLEHRRRRMGRVAKASEPLPTNSTLEEYALDGALNRTRHEVRSSCAQRRSAPAI